MNTVVMQLMTGHPEICNSFMYFRVFLHNYTECGHLWSQEKPLTDRWIGRTLYFAVSHHCMKLAESTDSYLTRIKKPCIMIDKELLLLKSYLLELLINNRYTHKEKKQWQKLKL